MDQTPAHERHNPDLLKLMPKDAKKIVEIGCSSGALAREYKKVNMGCQYVGVECVSSYIELAKRHCDSVVEMDIENADEQTLQRVLGGDCWVFGDVLEHLRDPWALLNKIRNILPADGCVVACIPNAQHWSLQAKLSCGAFVYEDSGLLDRTHLRWFTRQTIIRMFADARFKIVEGGPRIFDEPLREQVLPIIRSMAATVGGNPEQAVQDALPLQYVLRAVPV